MIYVHLWCNNTSDCAESSGGGLVIMNWEGGADALISGHYLDRLIKHIKKIVETASGQSFFPNMKHAHHSAQYDAWYQIKDYFNNEKSKCLSLSDSSQHLMWTADTQLTGCEAARYSLNQ